MRRAACIVLAVVAVGAAACGEAGGEAAKAAEGAAQSWLAVVDAGDYGKSWDEAAAFFRNSLSRTQWEEALRTVRAPLGRAASRKLKSATFTKTIPGAPDGEYVVIQFDTDFANGGGKVETITPMKDPDGSWRVSGYYIE